MKTKSIKNYLKISAFLLLALLLFKNCESDNENLEIETETIANRTFGTVPIHQAKIFFNRKLESNEDDSFFRKSSNSIELTPNWETLEYEDLYQIDEAQLLSATVGVNRNGNYESKLIFINVNGQVKNAIYTIYEERTDADGTVLDARIYLNETDGTFIDGYKIIDQKFTKRYIVSPNGNVSQGSMLTFFQVDTEDDCWNTDNLPENGQLDEVDLGSVSGSSGGYNPSFGGIYSTVRDWNNAVSYGDGDNGSSGPSSGSGGYSGIAGTLYGNNVDTTEDEPYEDICPNGAINGNGECVVNPFLGADCRSFEYAQPPGALLKGCGVTDFDHRFYSGEMGADGSASGGYVESHFELVYFTMPPVMTNGQAANLTAIAVTAAITATDLYFFNNPDASAEDVGQEFINNIQTFMAVNGGQMVPNAPFNIPSPAPYLTSFFGASTDCN